MHKMILTLDKQGSEEEEKLNSMKTDWLSFDKRKMVPEDLQVFGTECCPSKV